MRTFPRDYHYVCKSPFLNIANEDNKTGKFFPMRAIRCMSVIIIIIRTLVIVKFRKQNFMIRCDTINQCPHGDDEENCHIPESARIIMSLFLIAIIVIIITT